MDTIFIIFFVLSLIANAILSYFLWATRKWFRLYRAGLHLLGDRTGIPKYLL